MKNRTKVLIRDGYKCTQCGSKDWLEIHHIIPQTKTNRRMYGEQIDSLDNLILVCHKCHDKHSLWDKGLKKNLKKIFKIKSKVK